MNHYRFTEEEGWGLLEKKVPGQPDTWKEDLRVPLPDDENIATKDYVDRKVQETVADTVESLYLDEQDTGDVTIQYDDGEEEDNNNN